MSGLGSNNVAGPAHPRFCAIIFPSTDYARERRPAGLRLIQHIKAEFLQNSALVSSSQVLVLLAPNNAYPQ